MRKLTILGLSLLLSVGAFAQPQLKQATAQKVNASTVRTDQVTAFKAKAQGRARDSQASVPGIVKQNTGITRVTANTPAKSKAKTAVTTDKLYAGMLYPSSMIGGVKVDLSTGALSQLYTSATVHAIGVNTDLNEVYSIEYKVDYNNNVVVDGLRYAKYDLKTGALKLEVPAAQTFDMMPQQGAYNPYENAIYGYANDGWVKVDCATFTSTLIAECDEFPYGMTYNSNTKQFVALVTSEDRFFLGDINSATGAITLHDRPIDTTSQYFGGFAYDYSSDSYLFNPNSDSTSEIVSIDATTLAVTTVCELPGAPQTGTIYVAEVKPLDPLAPMAPAFARASFPDGALSGSVTFTMPEKNQEGNDLDGTLSYTIAANGVDVTTGTAAPGNEVSATYNATASGEVLFTCVASLDTHTGKTASETVYVGNDTPSAPRNVKLTPTTVSWDAVTTGAHGGYVDPSGLTYTITINDEIVAEDISGTSCPTNLPVNAQLQNYVAKVTASCNGMTGAPGSSNNISFGQPLSLPISLVPGETEADLFTIVDNNKDGTTWKYNAGSNGSDGYFSCSYSYTKAMDDYLILPPVKISDISNLAVFSFDAWCSMSFFKEKVEVWIGHENTPEAMTTKILDTTVIGSSVPTTLTSEIQFPETGKWYVAVKGVSDRYKQRLNVNNFSLKATEIAVKGPSVVENVSLVPGEKGALEATVNFTIPTVDNLGNALVGDVEVDVDCDLEGKSVTGKPGSEQSVVIATKQGDNEITIQARQGDVLGRIVTANVYTGVEAPGPVQNFVMTPSEDNYGIYLKFDAPVAGVNGGFIRPEECTYTLYQYVPVGEISGITIYSWEPIADLGKTTALEVSLLPEGTAQASYQLAVAASNIAGAGDALSNTLTLGTPYEMPVIEKLYEGTISYQPMMINTRGGMKLKWMSAADIQNEYGPEYATDGNALVSTGVDGVDGEYGYWFLPAISTKGANKAALELSYYVGSCSNVKVYAEAYGIAQEEIFNQAYLFGYNETGYQTLPIQLPAKFQDKDWVNITIRLDFSADKSLFIWKGYRMINMVQKDMAVTGINAPRKVTNGNSYDVTVNLANYGLSPASSYSVVLYANDKKIGEKTGSELASYADGQVVFSEKMSPIATADVNCYAEIVQNGDANNNNNKSATITISPRKSNLPGATELTAGNSDKAVALTWNEPDLTNVTPEPVTDDFEDGDAFTAEYGDWVFVDVDDAEVGGFKGTDIPGITPNTTKGSFWIWDHSQLGNQTFKAHSGTKYLFSLFRFDEGAVDDWAISPQLCGDAQSVSFWARSYSAQYPESIEVYYSTGSTDPDDFKLIKGSAVESLPAEWTEYTVELPEGATRFAIRSVAAGSFMLMVDDVTYIPAGTFTGELTLKGYDIYRDGVKLNDAPVESTEYADANVTEGTEYEYVVVTMFEEGTGRVSNTAKIKYQDGSGLDKLGPGKSIATAKNAIIVSGFAGENVVISTADGKVVANGIATDNNTISVPAGIYVVKAGSKSAKVVVK